MKKACKMLLIALSPSEREGRGGGGCGHNVKVAGVIKKKAREQKQAGR